MKTPRIVTTIALLCVVLASLAAGSTVASPRARGSGDLGDAGVAGNASSAMTHQNLPGSANEASSSVITLGAEADALITTTLPNAKYGTDTSLGTSWTGTYATRSLVRFNLLGSALPSSAIIDSAVLGLYLQSVDAAKNDLANVSIGIWSVTSEWSESTVTWNNQPSATSTGISTSVNTTTGEYKSWNITSLVQSWRSNPAGNYGVLLRGPASGPKYNRVFRSKEYGSNKPRLVITYHNFCDSVTEIPKTECNALVALYNNTYGPGWTNKTGWLSTTTPCSTPWYGVTCSGGHVTELNLSSNNLAGSIPTTLSSLGSLRQLIPIAY